MGLTTTRGAALCLFLFYLSITNSVAGIISPEAGAPLPSDTITVTWEPTGTEYWIRVRDLATLETIYDSGRLPGDFLSHTFFIGEEVDDIDLEFYQKINGQWQSVIQLHDVSQTPVQPPVDPPMEPTPDSEVLFSNRFAICNDSVTDVDLTEGYACLADCPGGYLAIAIDTPAFRINGSLPDGAVVSHAVEGFGTPTIAVSPTITPSVGGLALEIETRYSYTCLKGVVTPEDM